MADDITELKRAYEVLGIPFSASAPLIKKSYRRIAKRWHPDLYSSGTPSYIEATRMMKVINEAYSLVEHAPLRHHIETYSPAVQMANQAECEPDEEWKKTDRDTLPMADRFGFWVRFVCGAILGAFIALRLFLIFFEYSAFLLLVAGGLILACGFGAAKYGDRFWHAIFDR